MEERRGVEGGGERRGADEVGERTGYKEVGEIGSVEGGGSEKRCRRRWGREEV